MKKIVKRHIKSATCLDSRLLWGYEIITTIKMNSYVNKNYFIFRLINFKECVFLLAFLKIFNKKITF